MLSVLVGDKLRKLKKSIKLQDGVKNFHLAGLKLLFHPK